MTALADIGRSSSLSKAMLAVASLKGSDLEEFNETHPRDQKGRFAVAGASPSQSDPRAERMVRRRRRLRRAVKASTASSMTAQAQQQALAQEPRVNLERIAQRRVVERQNEVRRSKPKAGPEQKSKPALDDESYMVLPGASMALKHTPSVTFVTTAQAQEFLTTGSLVVGAAEERWGTKMHSVPDGHVTIPEDLMGSGASGLVAIRMQNPHFIEGTKEGMESGRMASAQTLVPKGDRKSRGAGFTGTMNFIHYDGAFHQTKSGGVEVRVIDVDAWNANEIGLGVNRTEPWKGGKADESWDEDDHPRDFDTGQFVSTKISHDTPPTSIDPRIAREQRRRRRLKRAAVVRAAPLHQTETLQADPRVHERAPVERRNERIELQRRNAKWLAHQTNRAQGLRLTAQEEEKLAEEIFAMGPQIRSLAGIYPRHDPSEAEDVVGPPRRISGGAVVDEPRQREHVGVLDYSSLEDPLVGWDLANPQFKPGMKESDVPKVFQGEKGAFRRWQRAQARKAKQSPS